MSTLLFLCTGNYYRSRFAEILFNYKSRCAGLSVTADSRALALERGRLNVGSLSVHARKRLLALGLIADASWERMPCSVAAADFDAFDRVIALDEEEHRPLMHERHCSWENRIEYLQVHDLDRTEPGEALDAIVLHVEELIAGYVNR